MRRALRTALGALLILSLCWSAVLTARLFESGVPRLWADRQADRIAAEVDRQIARHATAEAVASRVEAHLAADPRNWLALDALLEEAGRAEIALPPGLTDRIDAAHDADFSWMARTERCLACTWSAEACGFDLAMLCRAPVEISPLGDLAGLVRAGTAHARGGDLDEVDLALSAIGLSATALVVATGGSSMAVKGGAGLGKLARRMGAMPGWMGRTLSDAARRGYDWAGLPGVRGFDDLALLARPARLHPAVTVLDDAGRVVKKAGPAGGLYLISRTSDAADLSKMARVSEAMGERTVGTAELLGKSRLLRAAVRLSDEAVALAISLATALAALAGLLLSAGSNAVLRRARRALR